MRHTELHESELTHSQLQIWIGQQLQPDSPLYNMAFAFVFPVELHAVLFQRAWRRVVEGSDALRTSFAERDGRLVRNLRDGSGHATEVVDFRDHTEPTDAFRAWCHQRCSRPLSLNDVLVDSVLAHLGDRRTGWYLNQHHLVADAWSTVLLYRQVAAEYTSLLADGDRPPGLAAYYPTAASLTAAKARAGHESRASVYAAARAHWAARLAAPSRVVPLYGLDSAPEGTASTRMTLRVDRDRSNAVTRLCDEDGWRSLSRDMSRFVVFATLLASWLHRISGQPDLGFDAPVAGRPTAQAKRSLGLFIEMFPFAVTVAPSDTFRMLARKCLEEAQLFLCHALPGTSMPSGATAGNVVLNFFPEAFGAFAGIPTEVEWIHPGHGDRVHALRLQVHDFDGSGRYVVHFDFNDAALPHELRSRSVEHFEHMLTALIDDPDRVIASVDLRTDEERRVFRSPHGRMVSLPDRVVVASFLAQAEATPDGIALREGRREVSFGHLAKATVALARTLTERGVVPGDRVAILGSRSISVVVAILATLRARAAYVPLDSGYPWVRLEQVLLDSGVRLLLLGEGQRAPESMSTRVLALPIEEGVRSGDDLTCDRSMPSLDDLAYLIYTSGSTGRPKGVLIGHGGLADYVQWAARHYVRGDRLTFPLFTSLAFDLTVTSLFLPLVTGGTLEIYPEPGGPVDSALMDVVQQNTVDFIKLTPSHLSLLRRLDLRTSRIRRMVVGGEDFKTELAASVSAQFGDRIEVYNEYGPTEAVVGCVVHRYDPREDLDARVPIGIPADNVEVEVLNEHGVPVPEGVPGELWVSRPDLARGYHGLEDATRERFRPHPARSGVRRYRTGDLVRVRDAGTLEYLGRLDRQLKISGYRVEPAEIEAAVMAVPTIEHCAVVVRRQEAYSRTAADGHPCVLCGLPPGYPGVRFDDTGLCSVCRSYESIKPYAQAYFKTMDDLRELFRTSARAHDSTYDCMMLLSGGKDSTYALCQLVEMGLTVYAFTLDNGFISNDAKANMRRVTDQLGVPLEFGSTPAMNAIFRDSLMRFSNVCHGCFKTIYTLSTNRAHALGIPIIVTGLSRGQMFETRLTENLFRDGRYSPAEVDAAVLEARRVYHRADDEVARSLDVAVFQDDRIFEAIQFVDFYRYCDVGLDDVLSYIERTVPWVRPLDTGRSTNCLINDVGIYIHRKERGYHNYALPYSWDVRLGHKQRRQALDELNDELDMDRVRQTLAEVGYKEDRLTGAADQPVLAAFYVSSMGVEESEVRRQLADRLPSPLVPAILTRVDAIPLTSNGKVDEAVLSGIGRQPVSDSYTAPEGPVEEYLVGTWRDLLCVERVGALDDFFKLGGTSLNAMDLMIRLCREFDITLPLETVFRHPTVRELAGVAEQQILDEVSELTDDVQ